MSRLIPNIEFTANAVVERAAKPQPKAGDVIGTVECVDASGNLKWTDTLIFQPASTEGDADHGTHRCNT